MEPAFRARVTRQLLGMFHSKRCSARRLQPTIAASPEDYIWGRGLPGAGAEGIQAVEGIISAVARGRQGVAALRIPAVYVATVSDTTFRTLNVISLLSKNKTKRITDTSATDGEPTLTRKIRLRWSSKDPTYGCQYGKNYGTDYHLQANISSFHPPCRDFPDQKVVHISKISK